MTSAAFGREPELALIEAALDTVTDGCGAAVHIVGEPGIGKTALLGAARELAQARLVVSRWATAADGDQRRPLALATQLLTELHAATAGDPVSTALASIDALASSGPVVLLADDVHWADGASLDVLAAIARRAEEIGVLLVTTARPHPVSLDLARFEDTIDRSGRRVALDTLTPSAIAALVEATMGARPERRLTRLLADASGNPFLTVELLWALEHDGSLRHEDGSLRLVPDAVLPARLSDRLAREAIAAAGNDSLLIRAAAVIPGGFLAEELASILTRPLADVIEDILHLSDARVLTEQSGRLAFRHDLIRQAIVDATPAPVVRALNRRAVTVLTAAQSDMARIASCLLVAANPAHSEDRAALIRLGMTLRDQNPFAAIDLLSAALAGLARDDPRHDDVVLALGWALDDLGRFGDVLGLLDGHFDDQAALRLDVRLLRGQALSLSGGSGTAIHPIPPDFDIAGSFATVDARAVAAVAELSTLELLNGHIRSAQRLVDWVESSTVDMEPSGIAYLADTQALLHARTGSFEAGLAAAQRGMSVAVEHPSSATWRARPTLTAAMMLDATGRGDEALHMLRKALGEPCPRWTIPLLQFGAAISLYRRGEWDDALAEIAAGLAATDELGMRLATAWPFAISIAIHSARGDAATARALLEQANEAVDRNAVGIEWMMYAAAVVEEASGAPQAAAKILSGVIEAALSLDAPAVLMNLSPDAARLAVATGDDETLSIVDDNLRSLARHTDSPIVHAFHDWVSGWQRDDFRRVERAGSSMAACGRGAEAARARHDAAVLAARAGKSGDARRIASTAFAGYEQLRAEQLHARLRAELRAAGVPMRPRRTPSRPTSGWESLTPTERRIVDLVADGRMNSEIAEQLFVSRRTVESHLARVYPKLGFPRRPELAVAARQRRERESDARVRPEGGRHTGPFA